MLKKTFSIVLVSALLVACDSSQDASKKNFLKAISKYVDQQEACFNAPGNFPYEVVKNQFTFGKQSALLDELVKAGILTSKETQVEPSGFSGRVGKATDGVRYDVADAGQPFVKKPENAGTLSRAEICYGEYEVVGVENFTEPAEVMGQKVSRVIYSYKLANVADWARKSEALQAAVPTLSKDIASKSGAAEREAVLVLTNNGWVHEKLFGPRH